MAVLLENELVQFADSARRFVADHYTRELRRSAALEEPGHSRAMWARYADLGWLGLPLPFEAGGAGGGAAEMGILLEASGRALLLEPLLSTLVIGAALVAELGDDAQRAAILPEVAAGTMTLAFAHAEPGSGHERLLVTTRADLRDGRIALSGEKRFVLDVAGADRLIVSARSSEGTLQLFLVAPDAPGLDTVVYNAVDGRVVGDITFRSTPAHPLGQADAAATLERVLDRATAALCAESMGIIAELNAATLAYAKSRRQFGQPIGSFQIVQHRLVDMMTAEQEGWAVTRCAQLALDDDIAEAPRIVSAAKARVDRIGRFVGEQSVQLHGGIGMSDELMVGHWMKRLMLNSALMGDAQWHLNRLGGGE